MSESRIGMIATVNGLFCIFVSKYFFYFIKDPGKPMQPIKYVDKSKTQLLINWSPPEGVVEHYNITVQCDCSCSLIVHHQVKGTTANITGLKAGTYCNMSITAVSGGLPSVPLNYTNIETSEAGNEQYFKILKVT